MKSFTRERNMKQRNPLEYHKILRKIKISLVGKEIQLNFCLISVFLNDNE